jgi:hypothetical protein
VKELAARAVAAVRPLAARATGAVLPLAVLALVAMAVPDGRPAARLLAAAAVLAVPFARAGSAVAVLGLPGAVALADAIAAGPISFRRVLATAALVGVAAFLAVRPRPAEGWSLHWWLAPGALVALWLLVAPGTWGWVGDARIGHWDLGAFLAVLAGGIAVAVDRARQARR